MVGDRDGKLGGKPAQTRWRKLAVRDGRTMVEFRPLTGRTHQIRAHAREGLGVGILGDRVYGYPGGEMLLHASRLVVPRGAKPTIDVTAPLPERFGAWADDIAPPLPKPSDARSDSPLPTAMLPTDLPEDALSEKFLAATGPGGQNVNKVATACQLRCDVFKLGLSPDAYARLKTIAGSKLTTGGELIITARRYRTQEANRADARERLAEMITDCPYRPGAAPRDQAEPFGEGQARR